MKSATATVRVTLTLLLSLFLPPAKSHGQSANEGAQFKEIQIAVDAFSLGEPIPDWVDQIAIPEVIDVQPVVVRLADRQYLVDQTSAVYVRSAMMINDAASLNSAGLVTIPFVPQYHKLKLHTVRVIRGGESLDRTGSSTVRFLQREVGLEQGVYSGEITASILVNDLRVGDTLEYSYTRSGQNPVFGDKFVDVASWDQGYPTLLRRIVLNHPQSRAISWRLIGERQPKALMPTRSMQDGMLKLVFEERSLPKVDIEPLTPPDYEIYRWLQFSEFSRWDDVAQWANGLFQVDGELNDELREVVARLRNKATAGERVVGALEFVQSEIRYFSVSLGESSHRPASPDAVLRQRYGDCKDKSLLLLTLLKALGIEAKPVLLDIGRRRRLDTILPGPQLFDHAIVQVTLDGSVFYLDPTRLGQHGKLGQMGQVHENAQVLVVGPKGAQLSTIASPNVRELSHSEWLETAALPKFGESAQLRIQQVWRGVVAEAVRFYYERTPRDQIARRMGTVLEQRYPGSTIVGEPDIQDDRLNNSVSVTASYTVPKLATEHDGNWVLRFLPGNMKGALIPPPSSARAVPLFVPTFPFDAKYVFEAKLPEDVSVVADPRASTVKSKYFNYTVTSSFRGNAFKTSIELSNLAGQVEVADLQKYGEDVRAAGSIPAGIIVIPKNAMKPARSAAKAKKDFAQTLRDRLQETIDKTTQTIKSGKLTGSDLAATYCLRSSSRSSLGELDAAISDATEAMKLNAESVSCRANTYFEAGEFEKSAADYSKAIALGATSPRYFHLRGISKFYAGKLDEAADDLTKATDTDDKEAQVYSDLWLSWTYQRLGKALPEAILTRAKSQPRGDWPRPALAVMAGTITPNDMLELVERKSGDDRRMGLSEGYFYLGQYYLGRGDKAKARELFQKARDQNVVIYMEHAAAGFEIKRLRPDAAASASIDPPGTVPGNLNADAPPPGPKSREVRKKANLPRKAAEDWTSDVWKRQ